MSDYGVITAADAVRFERVLPGPIDLVWSYLTDSEKRGRWLASGAMDLRVGGRVELKFRHGELSSRPGRPPAKYSEYEREQTLGGKIIRCEPPKVLSFTWGDDAAPSEVTFELAAQGEDVLLIVTHRRIRNDAEMVSVAGGWHTHLAILADRLREQEPENFWVIHSKLEHEYAKRFASLRV